MPGLASAGVAILLSFQVGAPSEVASQMWERWTLLGLFAVGLVAASGPPTFVRAPVSMLWVASPLAAIGLLQQARIGEPVGPWVANLGLVAIVPLWLGDSAAYFVGRSVGKRPLAPSISPNKTWEGAIANLVGCAIGALACGAALGLPMPTAIAVGATQGVFGQLGDLFESRLKRRYQVKDAGALLPGHGGILDRTDSLLATAPLVAILVSVR
jgi:phosphatidate cytidylyltransferase